MRSIQVSILRNSSFKTYGQHNTVILMRSTTKTVNNSDKLSVIHKYLCTALLVTLFVGRIYNLTQHLITAHNCNNFSKVTSSIHLFQFQLDTIIKFSILCPSPL